MQELLYTASLMLSVCAAVFFLSVVVVVAVTVAVAVMALEMTLVKGAVARVR